jgi:hypothetical protein
VIDPQRVFWCLSLPASSPPSIPPHSPPHLRNIAWWCHSIQPRLWQLLLLGCFNRVCPWQI